MATRDPRGDGTGAAWTPRPSPDECQVSGEVRKEQIEVDDQGQLRWDQR